MEAEKEAKQIINAAREGTVFSRLLLLFFPLLFPVVDSGLEGDGGGRLNEWEGAGRRAESTLLCAMDTQAVQAY